MPVSVRKRLWCFSCVRLFSPASLSRAANGKSGSKDSNLPSCLIEQLANVFVGGLRKILVPCSDCYEWLRCRGANNFLYLAAKLIAALSRPDRNRHDDPLHALCTKCARGRQHGGAGCQAIIHQRHRAIPNRNRRSPFPIQRFAAFQFALLSRGHLVNEALRVARIARSGLRSAPGRLRWRSLQSPIPPGLENLSLRTRNTSSSASRARAISNATGTPPRGRPKTTALESETTGTSASANTRPASARSLNKGAP